MLYKTECPDIMRNYNKETATDLEHTQYAECILHTTARAEPTSILEGHGGLVVFACIFVLLLAISYIVKKSVTYADKKHNSGEK